MNYLSTSDCWISRSFTFWSSNPFTSSVPWGNDLLQGSLC